MKKSSSQEKFDFSADVFDSLDDDSDGYIGKDDLISVLEKKGILASDPRIESTVRKLTKHRNTDRLSLSDIGKITSGNATIIERALKGMLAIPNFDIFREAIIEIYKKTIKNKGGNVASYIPELAKVNPEQYGISICTVDGQRFNIGDYEVPYSIQSTCKPINYCIALDDNGEKFVHDHVEHEQSGVGFNGITLTEQGLPHNPMINAGAIMCCSMIKPKLSTEKQLRYVMDKWMALSGDVPPGFDEATFESEKATAYRNFALAFFMEEHRAFPEGTDTAKTLDLYFMACSIQMAAEQQAVAAATLANGGVCPVNGKRVLNSTTAKHCLSMMYSSGMYDFSGTFAFEIGLPAKSGVSGTIMLVIPNVMGIAVWSPRLDKMGNSVRGIEFSKELVKRFNFHIYDSVSHDPSKTDPRLQTNQEKIEGVMAACDAASKDDLNEIKRLESQGVDLNDADYDGRTPIHLAASEGHVSVIKYFIARGINLKPRDRWGGTPLTDAIRGKHTHVIDLLKKSNARTKK